MKKTLVSLAAVAALTTGAMAADKGIDIVTTGQAVVYYETSKDDAVGGNDSLFNKKDSQANVGVQLNLGADLGNNFTFGSQLTYLGTAGLEKNLVGGTKQVANIPVNAHSTLNELALTKIFVAKKIGNTTVKIGRQELPKSLSPLAFTEGWNVFKTTFDAILVVNSDIQDTTIVGAYVSGGTSMTLGTVGDLAAGVAGEAYMLTVQNKSIPMTAITLSYYALNHVGGANTGVTQTGGQGADAIWADVAIAGKDLPLGLKIGLQGGQISPEVSDDTTAMGAKVSLKPMDALTLQLAYSAVDDGVVAIRNTGTAIKTPLYTQMVYNQNAIALDADTFVVKAAYNTGMGTVIAQYGATSAGTVSNMMGKDYNEFDLMYKVKSGGVKYFAGLILRDIANGGNMNATAVTSEKDTRIRVWARYAF